MALKKFFFGLLILGAGLTLAHKRFATSYSGNPTAQTMSYKAIEDYIKQEMRRLGLPGVSLAIVEGDQIVYTRGFGEARPGGGAPTPKTPFVLGSTTKSITALAVMQLVEAGKVELDAPVRRYLPWFRLADIQASGQTTVRHLLNQTSGLPMIAGMVAVAALDQDQGAAERQARSLSTLKITRPPGAGFEYSNLNYNLLGLIIEIASGETYKDYIQHHIFDPLGMHHSYASLADTKQEDLAVGHRHWFGKPVATHALPIGLESLAAGGLISCAEDMARYLTVHLNGGQIGTARLLSSAGINEMRRPATEERIFGVEIAEYGMGWFITKINHTIVLSHGGNVPDYWSYLAILPDQNKGIVLLANADPWGLPFMMMEVGDGAAALLAGEQPPPKYFNIVPLVMRLLPLIPIVQAVGVLRTLRCLRSWRRNPASRPGAGSPTVRHILTPLIPNLSLAALLAYLRSSRLLGFMNLYMPDLAWIIRICGGFAGVWVFLRTGLTLRALRGSKS